LLHHVHTKVVEGAPDGDGRLVIVL